MNPKPLLFSSQSYAYLQARILQHHPFETGKVEVKLFPDGERYQRICCDVMDRDCILLGGTCSDSDTLELYDLACAIVKHGAKSLCLVVPYYGYSTMERAVHDGDVVTAKTRARLLSAIPQAARGNHIALMDLHAGGVAHYFEGGIVTHHLFAKEVIVESCRSIGGKDFVLASTDAGRAKWVESLANELRVDAAFVFKRRIDGSTTQLTAMNAKVEGKKVIIYDDMIRTGGSLLNAAEAYKQAGATEISAIATHGVLPGEALKKLTDSALFKHIMVTDTHPRALDLQAPGYEVISVARILSNWLAKKFQIN
jgi:ribose-phosphate pyrophosphokinase